MKKMSKLFSIAVAAVMTLCLCSFGVMFTASANYTITLKPPSSDYTLSGHQYKAYKVFDVASNPQKTSYVYTIGTNCIGSGDATHVSSNSYVDTVNSVTYSSNTITDATVRAFAEFLRNTYFNASGEYTGTASVTPYSGAYDASTGNVIIDTGTDAGYFLIIDINGNTASATSLVMLDTAANQMTGHEGFDDANNDTNININVKADMPVSLVKEVEVDDAADDPDSDLTDSDNWGPYTDREIGEVVRFRLTTRVPNFDFDEYSSYTYAITDTLDAGISYVDGSAKVYKDEALTSEIAAAKLKNPFVSQNDGGNGKTVLTFDFSGNNSTTGTLAKLLTDGDLNAATGTVDNLYIVYYVKLNGNAQYAVTGADDTKENINSAYITYSKSPYSTETLNTAAAAQTARIWTFGTDIKKYEANTSNTYTDTDLIPGAKFKIYNTSKGNPMKFSSNGNGAYYVDPNGALTELEVGSTAGVDLGKLTIYGLDDDTTYIIEESTVPDGYTKQGDTTLIFTAAYDSTGDNIASLLRNIGGNDKISSSGDNVQIKNSTSGTELIGTGGIGTTIFYVAGGILMAGALILLITKLRMKNKD